MPGALGIGMGLTFQGGGSPFWGLDHDGGDYSTSTAAIAGLSGKTTGSIGFWAKIPPGAGANTIYSVGVTSGLRTYLAVTLLTTKLFVSLELDGVLQWRWWSTTTSTIGDWHHFIVAHDGSTATFYMDGSALAGNFSTSTDLTKWFKTIINDATNKSDITSIGTRNEGGGFGQFYGSEITQVGVSSSVFSAADQARIMLDPNAVGDYDIAYYRMTPGSGQSVLDASGNGYHMELGSTSGSDANDPTWIPTDHGYTTLLPGGPV